MTKIIVYRSSPYVIERKAGSVSAQKNCSISFEELRSWVRSGKIFSQLFRYRDSVMVVYDLKLISKPFASALLIRALARKKTIRHDGKGGAQAITTSLLFSLFIKLINDFFKKNKFIKSVNEKVNTLINSIQSNKTKKIDITQSPVYLRTDFCFGLQSGGSVGHIAGVVNHLSQFSGKPIFLTTDLIPTVSQEWESHIVTPGNAFWDFSELPPLHFNEVFLNKAIELIGNRKPSFIYQRYSINNFSGVQIARHYRVPFVLEFNGSEIWVNRHWGDSVLKYEALAEEIEMLNLKASDLVVTVSEPLKAGLIARGIDSEKILVNPNGVNPETYSPSIDGGRIRQMYSLENKIVLGFIGTFGKWHGAEVLAKSFGLLLQTYPELKTKVRLLMIGDGMTMPSVKQILSQWAEYSILTGTVPQEAGPLYLAACDILVASHVPNVDQSPFFGSPTKLFEYMAMGKGIVASNLDQIGEVLEHNRTAWMVKPGDTTSLMMGLKTLIDDGLLRLRLGRAAREEVVAKYTWKEHTRKIIESLTKL